MFVWWNLNFRFLKVFHASKWYTCGSRVLFYLRFNPVILVITVYFKHLTFYFVTDNTKDKIYLSLANMCWCIILLFANNRTGSAHSGGSHIYEIIWNSTMSIPAFIDIPVEEQVIWQKNNVSLLEEDQVTLWAPKLCLCISTFPYFKIISWSMHPYGSSLPTIFVKPVSQPKHQMNLEL